ncbi:MAG TPA: Tad domain-containing protein [Anaerolineales bacterium]|nr:Tad domain-containing protein [Anaerolineales bacterium]
MITKASEKGQALILITLAAVGLFSFAALAIDGSAIFSDRRHAQNAADTAALDAALAKVRQENWETEGLSRASSNGYNNNGTTNEVVLYNPPVDGPYQGNDQYIQVKIRSDVEMSFARVIGFQTATNRVQAVARASVPEVTTWFSGHALVSVMEGCRTAGDPHDPFVVGGNSTTIINNSGIFVNSTCDPAFEDTGISNSVTTSRGVCVVGGVEPGVNGINPPPTENCGSQIDPDMYQLLNPVCDQPGLITGSGGNYEAWPGYFNRTGNQSFPDESPSGTLKLHKGIYCLENGISLNGNWDITTDLNGNDVHDSDSEGVLFFIPDGDVTFNGGSNLSVHAISSTAGNFPARYLNYLIYIPPSNEANVTVTGNNGSTFTGTILAPASHITLDGSGNTFSLDTQIIGYNTTITGSGRIEITFNQANNGITLTQPGVQLSQ